MYSRYLQTGTFIPEAKQNMHPPQNPPPPRISKPPQETPPHRPVPSQEVQSPLSSALRLPFLSRLQIDSSDLLILMILLLLMKDEDNSTMLTAIALYFFL